MLNFLLSVKHWTRPFVYFSIIYKNILLLESRPILQMTELWLREAKYLASGHLRNKLGKAGFKSPTTCL